MARRKKKTGIPPTLIKVGLVIILALAIGFGVFKACEYLLMQSPYFQIREVVTDDSLNFIDKSHLGKLKGKSIFSVNLKKIQQQLGYRYPQVSQLRIVRRLPNQIRVVAKQRKPAAQTRLRGRTLTLDDNGVILSTTSRRDGTIPFIQGFDEKNKKIILGQPLGGKDVRVALQLVQAFKNNRILESYTIKTVHVGNLSKIEFILSNDLKVWMDQDNVIRKMKVLGIVLTKGQLVYDDINYLDLRFKEPIIGKK